MLCGLASALVAIQAHSNKIGLLWLAASALIWLIPHRAGEEYLRSYRLKYGVQLPLPTEPDYPAGVRAFPLIVLIQKQTRELLRTRQGDEKLEMLRRKANRRYIWLLAALLFPFYFLMPLAFLREGLVKLLDCY